MAKIFEVSRNVQNGDIVEQEIIKIAGETMKTALAVYQAEKGVEPISIKNIDSNALIADETQKIDFTATITPVDSGVVSPSSFSVYPGTSVIFTATPAVGYLFSKYTKNGVDVESSVATMEIGIASDGDAIVAVFVTE